MTRMTPFVTQLVEGGKKSTKVFSWWFSVYLHEDTCPLVPCHQTGRPRRISSTHPHWTRPTRARALHGTCEVVVKSLLHVNTAARVYAATNSWPAHSLLDFELLLLTSSPPPTMMVSGWRSSTRRDHEKVRWQLRSSRDTLTRTTLNPFLPRGYNGNGDGICPPTDTDWVVESRCCTDSLKNMLQLLKTRSGAINQLSPIEIN